MGETKWEAGQLRASRKIRVARNSHSVRNWSCTSRPVIKQKPVKINTRKILKKMQKNEN